MKRPSGKFADPGKFSSVVMVKFMRCHTSPAYTSDSAESITTGQQNKKRQVKEHIEKYQEDIIKDRLPVEQTADKALQFSEGHPS